MYKAWKAGFEVSFQESRSFLDYPEWLRKANFQFVMGRPDGDKQDRLADRHGCGVAWVLPGSSTIMWHVSKSTMKVIGYSQVKCLLLILLPHSHCEPYAGNVNASGPGLKLPAAGGVTMPQLDKIAEAYNCRLIPCIEAKFLPWPGMPVSAGPLDHEPINPESELTNVPLLAADIASPMVSNTSSESPSILPP